MKLSKIFILLAVAAMTSCTIVDLEDPLKGKITLATAWDGRTAGVDIPASYTVEINNQGLTFTQATNPLPGLDAGTYPVHIYNTPEKVTVSGTAATVATDGNAVDPLPGWLFTAIAEATYADFKEETVTAEMRQQIRQLTIELTVAQGDPQRIASTAATLTGIANSLDFKTNAHGGTNLPVVPVFTRDGDKLTAMVRLLGTVTAPQLLTLDITFSDGRTQTVQSDLSGALANFNTGKHIPLTASANLNTPVGAGFAATITGWTTVQNSGGTAW